MISIVLYGRNDSYGYNLHKRAALSLNCMASLLSDPDDEILFVDYNTPDDFPTFPEAIRDTLTDVAKRRIRIFRARPEIHRRFRDRTHLPVIEAIARNIAVRRSNPANRWILSSNTDLIFVSLDGRSISEIAKGLAPGYYHVPRYDIPESMWETFDRRDPVGTIAAARHWGRAAHLNEIVYLQPFCLYDAPGDFQLVQRDDLFTVNGFWEDMLLGWHVDSNLSKRLSMIYEEPGDLSRDLLAYHCNHTRQATPKHIKERADDWAKVVAEIDVPGLHSQATSWGCPRDKIEELSLLASPGDAYRRSLGAAIGEPMTEPAYVGNRRQDHNLIDYDSRHVLPYLADLFVNCPRHWQVGWYGGRPEILELFAHMWQALEFTKKILVDSAMADSVPNSNEIHICESAAIIEIADAFVFDFGNVTGAGEIEQQSAEYRKLAAALLRKLHLVIDDELAQEATGAPLRRRIVAINTINSYLENVIEDNIVVARTRLSTRLRHGVVHEMALINSDWLGRQLVGPAGIRDTGGVRTRPGASGHVVYGPYALLSAGRHRIVATIRSSPPAAPVDPNAIALVFEVAARERFLAQSEISWRALEESQHVLFFEITEAMEDDLSAMAVEARIWTDGNVDATIDSVMVERVQHKAPNMSSDFRIAN